MTLCVALATFSCLSQFITLQVLLLDTTIVSIYVTLLNTTQDTSVNTDNAEYSVTQRPK